MKSLALVSLSALAGIALLFGALYSLPEFYARIRDGARNRRAYENVVRPACDWVRAFHQQSGRLPTSVELDGYAKTNWLGFSVGIFDSPPTWQNTWGRLGVDFMVCAHTGEWNLYRQSWDGGEWKAWTE